MATTNSTGTAASLAYRREMAARGRTAASELKQERLRRRQVFLDRLALIKRDKSLREFGKEVGIPHTTIHSWGRDPEATPNMDHLQAIANFGTLPGVAKGRIAVDWLVGLTEEPSRDARAAFGQLPSVLAAYVAREVAAGLRTHERAGSQSVEALPLAEDLAVDATAILERIVRGEVEVWVDRNFIFLKRERRSIPTTTRKRDKRQRHPWGS